MEEIFGFIKEFGFAAVVAFWSLKSQKDNSESHLKEMLEFTKAIDKNSEAINRMCDRFDIALGDGENEEK